MASSGADINAKILYWGLPYAGKTANLAVIREKLRQDHRGDIQRLTFGETPYEILPIELGQIQGRATRFQIYSIPGAANDRTARQELSKNTLGIVFVVDAQASKLQDNIALYQEMVEIIHHSGIEPFDFPVVLQYNKLDLPNTAAIDELESAINVLNYPHFKAVANQGTGVLPTLTTISKTVIRYLRDDGAALSVMQDTAPPAVAALQAPEALSPPPPSVTVHATPGSPVLSLQQAGNPTRNADGSFRLPLQMTDSKTGAKFTAHIRLEVDLSSGGLVFKIMPGRD